MNTTQLDRLRRQAGTKAVTALTRLAGRPAPWRDWQSLARELTAMGFSDIDHPDQTQHELEVLDWFLSTWLDLLPVTDGILWPDPDDNDRG